MSDVFYGCKIRILFMDVRILNIIQCNKIIHLSKQCDEINLQYLFQKIGCWEKKIPYFIDEKLSLKKMSRFFHEYSS